MDATKNNEMQGGLLDAPRLLESLFPDSRCRPSLRWLRDQVAGRQIPFIRIGRLVFFNPQMVRSHFDAKALRTRRVA